MFGSTTSPLGMAESDFQQDLHAVSRYFRDSLSEQTQRAYATAWDNFSRYCASRRRKALPADPETIAGYLSSVANDYTDSTLRLHLSAIRHVHRQMYPEETSPTRSALVENVLAGVVRSDDRTSLKIPDKAAPLRTIHIQEIMEHLPGAGRRPPAEKISDRANWLRGLRDRTILLVGFAGALRRSEISGLRVQDLQFKRDGALLFLPQSKSDQESAGTTVPIASGENVATCPVEHLKRWLNESDISEGPVFRGVRRNAKLREKAISGRAISSLIKKAAAQAGLAPGYIPGTTKQRRFSGHSLRAGHITEASARGVSDHVVMQQSRHVDRKTFDEYVRPEKALDESSSKFLGL